MKQNFETQTLEFSISLEDQKKLLAHFKELRLQFEHEVKQKEDEPIFWHKFLKKNHEKGTEIFGGRNPIFIPGAQKESDYDQKYIHNQDNLV